MSAGSAAMADTHGRQRPGLRTAQTPRRWRVLSVAVSLLTMLSPCTMLPAAAAPEPLPGLEAPVRGYTCPMHPQYLSETPGTCPICGMDLVAIGSAAGAGAGGERVTIAPEIIQNIGVRTRPVTREDFGRMVRAFGAVEASTRLQSVVASRVEGWIEELAVTAEGDPVRRGELLYRVFSPDLIAAQQDYLAALRAGNEARISSAARRLRSLGMQESVAAALARDRGLIEHVPVYAEADGVIDLLAVRDGAYVKPGDLILRLQSYDEVWVVAAVAEQDLAQIALGMPARLDFPSVAGNGQRGTVDYVYPEIDPRTRTGRVRIVVDNRDGAIKPGAYADVRFEVSREPRLAVPAEAVLFDSRGSHVMVALGEGRFAGRTITTGISAGGLTEVVTGLQAGERVVVSGQFMLDSEASLRETLTRFGGDHAGHRHGSDAAPVESGGHDGPSMLPRGMPEAATPRMDPAPGMDHEMHPSPEPKADESADEPPHDHADARMGERGAQTPPKPRDEHR